MSAAYPLDKKILFMQPQHNEKLNCNTNSASKALCGPLKAKEYVNNISELNKF